MRMPALSILLLSPFKDIYSLMPLALTLVSEGETSYCKLFSLGKALGILYNFKKLTFKPLRDAVSVIPEEVGKFKRWPENIGLLLMSIKLVNIA